MAQSELDRENARREIDRLSALLHRYGHEYFVLGRPSVSDAEYDRLFDQLRELEQRFPGLVRPESPTARVGSDLSSDLPEVEHTIPVLSLDKAYTVDDIRSWIARIERQTDASPELIVEEKIDGVSIVLYYEAGLLTRAVTRGNGFVGNDVTANVRTIRSVPLRLPDRIDIAVRGEIYLPRDSFEELNKALQVPYANPRNLAAGSIRRVRSSEVAAVPLSMFAYESSLPGADTHVGDADTHVGDADTHVGDANTHVGDADTHVGVLKRLRELGFRLNPRLGFFSEDGELPSPEELSEHAFVGDLADLERYVESSRRERSTLEYEIDGLVLKINNLAVRERLGYTGHHPRWAVAFKFDPPEGVSRVRAVDVQIGRTGRATPVARIEPVSIAGSTVSNVTLHNQDYVDILELAVGDTVAVSKRGDVIPAVERVVEKNEQGNSTWTMPQRCPSCESPLVVRGAHHFCSNSTCLAQTTGRLYFFVGRNQMDIDGLGPETVDVLIREGLVEQPADLYSCDYDRLLDLPGFGEKKVAAIKRGVEESKTRPFRVVLPSLGIPELGQKLTELIIAAGINDIDTLLGIADDDDIDRMVQIDGIGEKTAKTLVVELRAPATRQMIAALRDAGLQFAEASRRSEPPDKAMSEQTWCVTGSFTHYKPRDLAMEEVKKRGGRVVSQVTGKTTHLLAGEGSGSKLDRARELGVTVVSEEEFLAMLGE